MLLNSTALDARHPFEVFILTFCAVGTVIAKLVEWEPLVVERIVPFTEGWTGWITIAGSSLALTAMFIRDRVLGLLLEQVGMVCLGTAAIYYALLVLISYENAAGVLGGALLFWFGATAFRRWGRIQNAFKEAREIVERSHGE